MSRPSRQLQLRRRLTRLCRHHLRCRRPLGCDLIRARTSLHRRARSQRRPPIGLLRRFRAPQRSCFQSLETAPRVRRIPLGFLYPRFFRRPGWCLSPAMATRSWTMSALASRSFRRPSRHSQRAHLPCPSPQSLRLRSRRRSTLRENRHRLPSGRLPFWTPMCRGVPSLRILLLRWTPRSRSSTSSTHLISAGAFARAHWSRGFLAGHVSSPGSASVLW